eukprot:328919-Amphidinium_carterae.1
MSSGESVAALVLDVTDAFFKIPPKHSEGRFAVGRLSRAARDIYQVLARTPQGSKNESKLGQKGGAGGWSRWWWVPVVRRAEKCL